MLLEIGEAGPFLSLVLCQLFAYIGYTVNLVIFLLSNTTRTRWQFAGTIFALLTGYTPLFTV